jgi:hypothetical protein
MGATPTIPMGGPGGGGPPPPGGGMNPQGPTASPTPAVVQIVGGIAELLTMLQQTYPPSAPQVQQMQDQLQQIQSSMAQTQNPAQTQAPPI